MAIDGKALGIIQLKDIVKGGMKERFAHLRAMGIKTVMITGDNPLTAAAIAQEAGVDDFLAQARPEHKMDLIKKEQAEGRLVAMTGDGTNDAPALAQADVGVAMNSGTQAAKEAGNMVDLDSNPTKLIEIVEIGKQLLMTRGALTTFSIANDVAKYFAIIPAMFATLYVTTGHGPLWALNIMKLHSAYSAVLAAVIFNALVIIAFDSCRAARGGHKPDGAAQVLRRNLAIWGVGGILYRFRFIWLLDEDSCRSALRAGSLRDNDMKQLIVAIRFTVVLLVICCGVYPLVLGGSRNRLPVSGKRQPDQDSSGQVIGSELIGQNFSKAVYFPPPPSAAGNGTIRPRAGVRI